MKKKSLIMAIVLPAILLVAVIYNMINNNVTANDNVTTNDDVTIVRHYDVPIASSLNEMNNEAEFVVIGEYKSFDSKWNMQRDPNNVELESKDGYIEGHLYNFEISEVLKGNLQEKNILVNHKYLTRIVYEDNNEIINNQGIVVKEATSSKEYVFDDKDPLFIEPEIGNKYVLFLNKDTNFSNYYGAIEPFSIKFDENNIAELQSNLIEGNTISPHSFKTDNNNITIVHESESQIIDNISGVSYNELIEKITSSK